MSGNPSQQPRQSADEFVRSILDDRPPEQVSPSGELFRVIDRFHRSVDRARQTLNDISSAESSRDSNVASRNLHHRFSREPTVRDPRSSLATSQSTLPLPPLRNLNRRGSSMSSGGGSNLGGGRASRYRPSESRSANLSASLSFANDLESRFGSSTTFPPMLNFPTSTIDPPLSPPLMSTSAHIQERHDDNRRVKRRKLDSDRLPKGHRGFRYGRYGQVEPGRLRMEIVSCDGGIWGPDKIQTCAADTDYTAENILKDDSSVYCTKGSRCNIVLRHQDATVFSLKELVIKAPGRDFCSPVREGMVFISMSNDDLLKRTARYQIQYAPVRVSTYGRSDSERRERDSRALAPIISIQHLEDGTTLTGRIPPRQRRVYSVLDDSEECMAAQIPSEFTASAPPFRVTTECSEEEGDEPGSVVNPRYRRRTPNRIGSLPFESDSSDDWGRVDDSTWGDSRALNYIRGEGLHMTALDDAVRGVSTSAARSHELGARPEGGQGGEEGSGGELMAPHARFFIEKDKNKCTIRFDPPVAGRFILLKMWSPHLKSGGNIDIQGVVAEGFAGPRYMPAVELR